jgi:serine/threonine protein kinase
MTTTDEEQTQRTVRAGQTMGPYRLLRVLGKGGFGLVFEAEHQDTGHAVAIKSLHAGGNDERDTRAYQRFAQEVEAIRRVQAPNVVQLFDTGMVDGPDGQRVAWFAMELLEGATFAEWVRDRGPVPPGQALQMVAQAARGLHAAHQVGVVHRDIKPHNLMWTHSGRAVVMDFGICRLTENERITATGQTVGTLRYLAPEHVTDQPLDGRADVWALGAVLFFLMTGRHLRAEDNIAAVLGALQKNRDARRVADDPHIPASVKPVLAACVSSVREERPKDAEELASRLEALSLDLMETVTSLPVLPPPPPELPAEDATTKVLPSATGVPRWALPMMLVLGVLLGTGASWLLRSAEPGVTAAAAASPAEASGAPAQVPAVATVPAALEALEAGRVSQAVGPLNARGRALIAGLLEAAQGRPCASAELLAQARPPDGVDPAVEEALGHQQDACGAQRAEEKTEPRKPARREPERAAAPPAPPPSDPASLQESLDQARRSLLEGNFSAAISQAQRAAGNPQLAGEAHKVMAVSNARLGRYCTAKGHYLVYLQAAPAGLRGAVKQLLSEPEFEACP